jgi:cytochrome b561
MTQPPANAAAPTSPRKSGAVGPLTHALIAVSVIFVFVSSWSMMALPLPSDVFTYRAFPFQLHKNVGITVVLLVFVMLYLRWAHARAARASGIRPRIPMSVTAQNVLLYGLVLVCSVSGYLSSAYSGWATRYWWLMDLPNWGYDNDYLNDLYEAIHNWTSYALLAVIAVHLYAATLNAFSQRTFVRRMLRL